MSQVAVRKIHSDETQSYPIIEELNALTERVRQRAYELFESRGCTEGSALNDWLTADNDLLIVPESDLIDTDSRFELQIAMPGFDANDIEVNALPDALIVRANKHEQVEGDARFCDIVEKRLFRKFELPAPIDVDNVTANLDKGVLNLTAPKEQTVSPQALAVGA